MSTQLGIHQNPSSSQSQMKQAPCKYKQGRWHKLL